MYACRKKGGLPPQADLMHDSPCCGHKVWDHAGIEEEEFNNRVGCDECNCEVDLDKAYELVMGFPNPFAEEWLKNNS